MIVAQACFDENQELFYLLESGRGKKESQKARNEDFEDVTLSILGELEILADNFSIEWKLA